MKRLSLIIGALIFLIACEGENKKAPLPVNSKAEYRDLMINSHKAYLEEEKAKLDEFEKQQSINFIKTGSGLRYSIYESEKSKDSIQRGDIAVIYYTLSLLNGDTAYYTQEGEPQEFIVALDDVEAGLHEGIQYMAIGDKAKFILPAHLAHGVSGDQAEIPAQSPVIYDVELIGKR